ncbi:MAG: GNAT family N-acetyltransferase [Actinomycetota bacterium]|nr:GNAT family N-acetyltransferase [Actinomycetota bacterium]
MMESSWPAHGRNEELVIEGAAPADYEAIARIVLSSYSATLGNTLDEGYAQYLARVEERARAATLLVARKAGKVVGTVTYVPDSSSPMAEDLQEGEAGMRILAVDTAAQGSGYGKALTLACIDLARNQGKRALFLHTTELMRTAQSMYASLGFQRIPERDWQVTPEVLLLAFRIALA